jgi:hypothetical protein
VLSEEDRMMFYSMEQHPKWSPLLKNDFFFLKDQDLENRIGDVMVSVLASIAVDRGFEHGYLKNRIKSKQGFKSKSNISQVCFLNLI